MSARGTGWLPDPESADDYVYSGRLAQAQPPLYAPPKLEAIFWRDQGHTSSCTGHAGVGAFEVERDRAGLPRLALSPRHAYQLALAYAGRSRIDGGAHLRDVVRGLIKLGVCREDICPLTDENVLERPSMEAEIDGVTRTIARYERITDPDLEGRLLAVQLAIAAGHPVICGKTITDAYERHHGSEALPPPSQGDRDTSGHATYFGGYRTELGGSVSLFEVGSWARHRWGIGTFAVPTAGWVAAEWLARCRDLWVLICETEAARA